MESLRESLVWSHHLKQLLQGTWSTQLLPLYLYLSLDAIGAVCHQFGLLGTDIHLYLVQVLSRFSSRASNSSSFSASASISSAKCRLIIFLPPMLTFQTCSFRASGMIRSRKISKRVGDRRHPSLTLTVVTSSEPFSNATIHLNCTCSLVELLSGAN